jgi:hypothetical protein
MGGATLGMFLRGRLPAEHLCKQSKEIVQLGTGLVATMAALVLGLLVASAMDTFDAQRNGVREIAGNIVLLDEALAHYGGPTATIARQILRARLTAAIQQTWPDEKTEALDPLESIARIAADGDDVYDLINKFAPTDDAHRSIQSQAQAIVADLAKTRWQLSHPDDTTIPELFVALVVFWLFVLFVSFGLFSPANTTVFATLLVCAISVSGAMLMIIDLDQPSRGLVRVSSTPLRSALEQIGRKQGAATSVIAY